jgi:hypothetical protein
MEELGVEMSSLEGGDGVVVLNRVCLMPLAVLIYPPPMAAGCPRGGRRQDSYSRSSSSSKAKAVSRRRGSTEDDILSKYINDPRSMRPLRSVSNPARSHPSALMLKP